MKLQKSNSNSRCKYNSVREILSLIAAFVLGLLVNFNLSTGKKNEVFVDDVVTVNSWAVREGGLKGKRSPTITESRLLSAVSGLRCLTTPGCYPNVPCASNMKPSKIKLDKVWEEHSFCVQDLLSKENNKETKSLPCLVYSFGLFDSVDWESKMAIN